MAKKLSPIDEKQARHIDVALRYLKKDCTINDGKLSYSGPYYRHALPAIHSLVRLPDEYHYIKNSIIDSSIRFALNNDSPSAKDISEYIQKHINTPVNSPQKYIIIQSLLYGASLSLKARRIDGCSFHIGSLINHRNQPFRNGISKPALRAIQNRSTSLKTPPEAYLPPLNDCNCFLVANISAQNEAMAYSIFAKNSQRYLSTINFLLGLGQSYRWNSNPLQPWGLIVPGTYTTIHDQLGKLTENGVYYDAANSFISGVNRHLGKDKIEKIERGFDYVRKSINRHYAPRLLWDAISLHGQASIETDKDAEFRTLWNCLERIMHFGTKETHQSMLERAEPFFIESPPELRSTILEGLRNLRNNMVHEGKKLGQAGFFRESPNSLIRSLVTPFSDSI